MGDAAVRHTPPPHEAKPPTTHHRELDGLPTPAGAANGGFRLPPSLAAGSGCADAAERWRKGAEASAPVASFSLAVSPAAGGARGGGAAADTFLASLVADERLPGALLGAAAPVPAPPRAVEHKAAAAVRGVVLPAFASQPAPDANSGAAVVEAMLAELAQCGWVSQRRGLDADAVERLRGEFRPGAAACALFEFAGRVRRSARRESILDSMSKVCISLAKEFSQLFQDGFIKQRITRGDVAAAVAPFAPPGAVQPALPADESDQAGALAAYRSAGWIGPGMQRISSSMFRTLSRWRGDPRTAVRALRRLPYIAAADLEAGCPLTACVFEESKAEFYKARGGVAGLERSRAGQQHSTRHRFHQAEREREREESKPRWREAQPRRRRSPEPRCGRSRELRDEPPRRRSYSREARGCSRERRSYRRSRSRSRSSGWGRDARGRSRERRSRSRERKRRSRSVSRSFGRREPRGRSAAQHAPASAPLAALMSGLEVPAYHYRNPRTGAIEAASPLSLFREGVVSGRIPLATAATTQIWRSGAQECTAAPLALVLAAQQE